MDENKTTLIQDMIFEIRGEKFILDSQSALADI